MFALMVSYNKSTGEVMVEPFEDNEAYRTARMWADRNSFVWNDFPESEGWVHFAWGDDEAVKDYGKWQFDNAMQGEGSVREWIPKVNNKEEEK